MKIDIKMEEIKSLEKEQLFEIKENDYYVLEEDVKFTEILLVPQIQIIIRRASLVLGEVVFKIRRTDLFEVLIIEENGKENFIKILNTEVSNNTLVCELKDYLLPIGSVVNIGIDKDVMITGRGYAQGKDNQAGYTDYLGVIYPEGMINNNIIVFNHEDINHVEHLGLQNKEEAKLALIIQKSLNQTSINKIDTKSLLDKLQQKEVIK